VQNSDQNSQSKLNNLLMSHSVISIEISLLGMHPRHPKCPEVRTEISAGST